MKKKMTALLVAAMILLGMVGCGSKPQETDPPTTATTPPQPTQTGTATPPASQPPVDIPIVEYDYFTKKELDHAAALGLIEAGADLTGDIAAGEFFALLEKAVTLMGGDPAALASKPYPDYDKTASVFLIDAGVGFYYAAQAMGIDTRYFNAAGLTVTADFSLPAEDRLFPFEEASIYVDDYDEMVSGIHFCANLFVCSHGSLVSNRAIMNQNGPNFELNANLTVLDAVLGAYRLMTSIEPEAEYVTLGDAKSLTYDPTIITDELLAAGNDLPEISNTDVPYYTAQCYLAKESAYQRVGNGWFTEDDIRSFAAAGVDFLSVRYDFSYFNYPDFNSGMVNLYELQQLDQLIAWGIRYGVHISIEGNGCINQGGRPRGLHWYNMDSQLDQLDRLCNGDPQLAAEFRTCWEILAARYAHIPAKYLSFSLICEPSSNNEDVYVSTFLPVAQAISSYDPDRVVFSYGNVGARASLAQYGYPMAWSIFWPDLLTQVEHYEGDRPVYEVVWNDWFLNGSMGPYEGIMNAIQVNLEADVVSAELYVNSSAGYVWGPSFYEGDHTNYVISLNGAVVLEDKVTEAEGWKCVRLDIPDGTTSFALTCAGEEGYLTCDGIIFTKADGTQIKVIPTTYEFPFEYTPQATVTVKADGTVTSDVPLTFDLILQLNDLGYYLEEAEEYGVGLIVAEWGPVKSDRTDEAAMAYFVFMAEGFRTHGITAAPSRTPGFSYSGLVSMSDRPEDFSTNPDRYIPVGDGSRYYIDTWEMEALTGQPYSK